MFFCYVLLCIVMYSCVQVCTGMYSYVQLCTVWLVWTVFLLYSIDLHSCDIVAHSYHSVPHCATLYYMPTTLHSIV